MNRYANRIHKHFSALLESVEKVKMCDFLCGLASINEWIINDIL